MFNLPHLMARLVDKPLALEPNAAATIYNVLCGRFGTAPMPIAETSGVRASRFAGETAPTSDGKRMEPYRRTPEGTAILTVDGELVNRGAWIESSSGLVSYEGFKFQLSRAAADPKTRSIVLDINSPGGEGNGAWEAAAAVRSAAEAKPVYAIANGVAASGAYALASGATRIFAAPSSVVGSIGVVMLHLDMSGALKKKGVSPTLLFAGAHKVDGNPVQPLTDDSRAELQALVDRYYEDFLGTVAAGRGRKLSAKAARATEARTFVGGDAVAAGLADEVGTFEEIMSEVSAKTIRAAARNSAAKAAREKGGPHMAEENQTEIEAAIAEAQARGFQAGLAAGAARMNEVLNEPRVKGHEAFALRLAAKAPNMSADEIGAMCADLPTPAPAPAAAGRDATIAAVESTGVNNVVPGSKGFAPQENPWASVISAANAQHRPHRGQ